MKTIRLTKSGHIYLNEHDISPFVVSLGVSEENVNLVLQGKIQDEREEISEDEVVFEKLPLADSKEKVSKPKKPKPKKKGGKK